MRVRRDLQSALVAQYMSRGRGKIDRVFVQFCLRHFDMKKISSKRERAAAAAADFGLDCFFETVRETRRSGYRYRYRYY